MPERHNVDHALYEGTRIVPDVECLADPFAIIAQEKRTLACRLATKLLADGAWVIDQAPHGDGGILLTLRVGVLDDNPKRRPIRVSA